MALISIPAVRTRLCADLQELDRLRVDLQELQEMDRLRADLQAVRVILQYGEEEQAYVVKLEDGRHLVVTVVP